MIVEPLAGCLVLLAMLASSITGLDVRRFSKKALVPNNNRFGPVHAVASLQLSHSNPFKTASSAIVPNAGTAHGLGLNGGNKIPNQFGPMFANLPSSTAPGSDSSFESIQLINIMPSRPVMVQKVEATSSAIESGKGTVQGLAAPLVINSIGSSNGEFDFNEANGSSGISTDSVVMVVRVGTYRCPMVYCKGITSAGDSFEVVPSICVRPESQSDGSGSILAIGHRRSRESCFSSAITQDGKMIFSIKDSVNSAIASGFLEDGTPIKVLLREDPTNSLPRNNIVGRLVSTEGFELEVIKAEAQVIGVAHNVNGEFEWLVISDTKNAPSL